ncbi:MAG: diguanylate cyclase [Deferribacteraceae bacterium]|jgi:diguanylate cyclase (GGDEF)-like protein|nr:diguanylate cyclase [Deferribacteraceae bacterium]
MDIRYLKQENIRLKRVVNTIQPYFELFESISAGEKGRILDKLLDICKRETESFQGFIGIIEKDNTLFVPTFDYLKSCKVKNKDSFKLINPLEEIGYLYEVSIKTGKPFYTNIIDYSKYLKNIPEGHIKITNFMSVPVIKNGKVAGIIALANSTVDYNDDSIIAVEKIANILSVFLDDEKFVNNDNIIDAILSCHDKDFLCVVIDNKIVYANNFLINYLIDAHSLDIFSLNELTEFKNIEIINIISKAYDNIFKKGKFEDTLELFVNNELKSYEVIATPVINDEEIVGASILFKDITEFNEIISKAKKDYEVEKFISDLLQEIYKGSDLDLSISNSLSKIGEYLKLTEISVYERENKEINKIYSWNTDKISNNIKPDSLSAIFSKVEDEGIIILSGETDDNLLNSYSHIKELASVVAYPMLQQGKMFGFIIYEKRCEQNIWSIREVELLKILSNIITSAILQKKADENLKYASTHDKLTGIYNRAYFETEIERVKKGRNFPLGIFIIDVNDLKIINDKIGHAAGDELIVNAAKILKNSVRSEDCLARIGGDEFAIIIQRANENAAKSLYQRILDTQEKVNQNLENKVSMAVGFSIAKSEKEITEATKKADENMYLHKRQIKGGRQVR